jgi:hypothetical protein
MSNFYWIRCSLLAYGVYSFGSIQAENQGFAPSQNSAIRGSGREEIAMNDDHHWEGHYENKNTWDYRTNWYHSPKRYLKGEIDMEEGESIYGTDTYYNQKNKNRQKDPNTQTSRNRVLEGNPNERISNYYNAR